LSYVNKGGRGGGGRSRGGGEDQTWFIAPGGPSHRSTTGETRKEPPQFKERWSRIKYNQLVVPWYTYPPWMLSKKVDTKDFKSIYYRKQDSPSMEGEVRVWGQGAVPCWWACDIMRCVRWNSGERGFYNVVVDTG
ncbi:hypothetical protein PMAYCL1PPCAC_06099, partial [Pristionchus mayeri]